MISFPKNFYCFITVVLTLNLYQIFEKNWQFLCLLFLFSLDERAQLSDMSQPVSWNLEIFCWEVRSLYWDLCWEVDFQPAHSSVELRKSADQNIQCVHIFSDWDTTFWATSPEMCCKTYINFTNSLDISIWIPNILILIFRFQNCKISQQLTS